MDRFQRQRV